MEHINIVDLSNGYKKLTPDTGYILKEKSTGNLYTEAITKTPERFEAVLDV